ncbi:hypothetical protein BRADI_3g36986v3 [Brachypodium distachyon]|uniref:Uncharacterized protein n=1 Tax=Brachypodium distachyon TaxID=15368 RepID=A0A2K2D1N2_BRADI|nr:hypothetical protein BRADI_3g36986v3 [Brachypodium distachyon]
MPLFLLDESLSRRSFPSSASPPSPPPTSKRKTNTACACAAVSAVVGGGSRWGKSQLWRSQETWTRSPPPRSTRSLPRNFQRSRRTWSTRSPSMETDNPTSARSFSLLTLSLPRLRDTRSMEISRSLPRTLTQVLWPRPSPASRMATCSRRERSTERGPGGGLRARVLRYAASGKSPAARTIWPSTTTATKNPEEGSGDPEAGKRARVRSHARSTRRSPPAANRLDPRRRQRSQGRTRKARVSSSGSSPKQTAAALEEAAGEEPGVGGHERRRTARSERPSEVRDQESATRPRWVS